MRLTYREHRILMRETEAWRREERRRRALILGVMVAALLLLIATGTDCALPTHGRGC
jgi:hypothetical protein